MGMSAGQARLLSITARLTDNELKSQLITNSKLRLAEKSTQATTEYMEALDAKKIMFQSYDDNGLATHMSLTPNMIYQYSPLKNQYNLINPSGQVLVSAKDAENFNATNSLEEFLYLYGVTEKINGTDNLQYQEDLRLYDEQMKLYDEVWYPAYLEDHANWEVEKATYDPIYAQWEEDYATWESEQNGYDVYQAFVDVVGTSGSPNSCYANAINSSEYDCYEHLLGHLLLMYNNESESNKTFGTSVGGLQVEANYRSLIKSSKIYSQRKTPDFVAISEEMCSPATVNTHLCDGDDDLTTEGQQDCVAKYLEENPGNHAISGPYADEEYLKNLLKSDYKYNVNGEKLGLKTLMEKAVDLLYILEHGLITDPDEMKETLINFTDGDMKKLASEPPEKPTLRPEPKPPTEPQLPEVPKDILEITDEDKAQWYINLWYAMNGSSTANKLQAHDATDFGHNYFTVENKDKDESKANYKVLEDHLASSNEWLQFALENGIVTLKQAQYFNPSENGYKNPELTSEAITWNSIIYSSASDFVVVDDEIAIAKAEVKYKNAITEIENKDKKYDQDLKKLDTEHTALQTEYESIKETISKNVERSFKAFS